MTVKIMSAWTRFIRSPVRKLGLLTLTLAVVLGLLGYRSVEEFLANASTELASIALTVLIIDYLNEHRAEQQLKAQLIREMGSRDNADTLKAIRELEARGWLRDGSLRKANLLKANLRGAVLSGANLEGVYLSGADLFGVHLTYANLHTADLRKANLRKAILRKADLSKTALSASNLTWANLKGAVLRESNLVGAAGLVYDQLAQVHQMQWATMPDGVRYDGRLNLRGDIEVARRQNVNGNDMEAMADFYGVSLEDYMHGQEWARENLPKLRAEAGAQSH